MKKIIAMISAVAMCAAMLTACSSEADTAETTAADTTVAEVTDETVNDTAAEGDIIISEEADTEAVESETTAETMEEVPAETEESADEGDAPAEDGEVGANPLQAIVDAGLAVGEWPAMMEVTDTMMLTDYFMLDPENANYRNMIVMQCPMSATMTEIIIIEADDVEAAKADLNARRDKAISQDAWYPNDVELAEASIVGTEGDFAYFILAGAAAEAEPAIVEAIKAL